MDRYEEIKSKEDVKMETQPFFSIIMSAFNVAPYIEETLQAINSQSFTNWELIIVDDCSTDDTIHIIRSAVKDDKIRIIKREKNSGGGFVPRCDGFKASQGKYIVHLDADDLIEKNYLEELHHKLEAEDLDMVMPEMWRFDTKIKDAWKLLPKSEMFYQKVWRGRNLVKYTLKGWEIPMAGYAVRREIFEKSNEEVKKMTESFHLADELQARFLLLFSDKVAFSSLRYLYRKNPNSVTSNRFNEALRLKVVNKELINFSRKYFGEDSEEYYLSKLDAFFFIFGLYDTLDKGLKDKSQKQEVKNIISEFRKTLNIKEFKGRVSYHYYISMSLPERFGRPMYRMIRFLRRMK